MLLIQITKELHKKTQYQSILYLSRDNFFIPVFKYFIIEGKHDFERNVIVEFPSIEKAKECYNSNEYQKAKSFRDGKANFNAIIIEGY